MTLTHRAARFLALASMLALAGACQHPSSDDRVTAEPAGSSAVYRVPIDGAPVRGDARALVTLVAFSDYECPFCARADLTLARLQAAYGARLRVVARQKPLGIHPHARAAAVAALAAHEQGMFWPMHEKLFANARSIDEEGLVRIAGEVGLDVRRWQAARAAAEAELRRDELLAETLGVAGTPTFFVNGRKLAGAQPVDAFKQLIDEEIARAEAMVARGVRPEEVYGALMKDAVEKGPPPAPRPGAKIAAAPAGPAFESPACDTPGGDCGCQGHAAAEPVSDEVEDVPVGASFTKGPERAPVSVVMFSDFECGFCRRSESTLRALMQHYGDRVRLVWKNLPLPIHPSARLAALAAFAAGEQGKFWEYHDALFAHQDALDAASLDRYATDLGLDLARFHRTMADPRAEAAIAADEREAARLGVQGTPTFFVNGRRIIGAQRLAAFQVRVERALVETRGQE
jgi:protein-disulfide isomerase